MRSAVLIAAVMIASSINPEYEPSSSVTRFYSIVILVAMAMDIIEFLNNIFRDGKKKIY